MTGRILSDKEARVQFARLITPIMIISARAIDQALDPKQRDLMPEDLLRYIAAVRNVLDLIDEMTK